MPCQYLWFSEKPGSTSPVGSRPAILPAASRGRHPLVGTRMCVLKTQVDPEMGGVGGVGCGASSSVSWVVPSGGALLKGIQTPLKLVVLDSSPTLTLSNSISQTQRHPDIPSICTQSSRFPMATRVHLPWTSQPGFKSWPCPLPAV